uniref:Uncharacterized protein n=1 Tax=Sphaerodactylus townsendi TaxID=933632 RepID=A0ACB8F324_9SAUR
MVKSQNLPLQLFSFLNLLGFLAIAPAAYIQMLLHLKSGQSYTTTNAYNDNHAYTVLQYTQLPLLRVLVMILRCVLEDGASLFTESLTGYLGVLNQEHSVFKEVS